ncbi:MAG TPA: hypothetical protein V6C65_34480 [Allocoleopsis sp.]
MADAAPSHNEKAVTIAVSLLKHKSPKTIQTLKNFLTFIPNPNHVKAVLAAAVINLVYHSPRTAAWLFQHPEVLAPEIDVRQIIAQTLTQTVYTWGYAPQDFYFDDDYQIFINEEILVHNSEARSPEDSSVLMLIAGLRAK